MNPNKILQIITKLELGGAQEIVLDLCRKLLAEKYEAILVTNSDGILVPDAKSIKGLKIYFLEEFQREINPINDLKSLLQLNKIIKTEKPDVVHTHSSKAGILGRISARINRVPVILHTIHGFGFNDYQNILLKKTLIAIEKIAAKFTDKLIAVSPSVMEKGVINSIGCKEKYQVIYNGIAIDLYENVKIDKNKKISEIGLNPNNPIVGMVACLKPQKAPEDFVRLADVVHKKISDAQFILIGDGVLGKDIESLIQELGLQKNVHLLGWQRDIPELLAIMDVFVLTSLWEGLPLTVIQAMAAGKPVVVNAIDGNVDIVRDGENGFLCAPGDIENMAEKVIFLLKNPKHAKEIGEKGNQFVRKFDKERMLEENIGLYKNTFTAKRQIY